MGEMNEAELIHGLRRGDMAALAALVDLYGDRLFRSGVLLCGSAEEARDLVQETFLQAVRSASRFRGDSRLYTWLFGILRNLAYSRRRRAARLLYTDALPDVPVAGELAGAALDSDSDRRALGEALARLSSEHREALVLRYYEDFSLEEMAACLGVPAGTVKSRLHYALREMRAFLPDHVNLSEIGDTYG
jgi:RNA polymerase sigma-70 factor, ECF subfamily